ncbi:MAG: hypothetical protein KDB03_08650 [Planctomycetales bacterium]|nr:hypothetical protein [Planctomycetales bacterium]
MQNPTNSETPVAVFVFTAFAVPALFSLMGASDCLLTLLLTNAFAIGLVFFSVPSHDKYLHKTRIAMLVYLGLLSSFAVLSYKSSLAHGSPQSPFVPGGDGEAYYALGCELSDAVSSSNFLATVENLRINYRGYPLILSLLFAALGKSLFVGIAFNYLLVFSSIILIFAVSLRTSGSGPAFYTTLLSCLTPHFFAQGTILQKDAVIIFAFALFLYSSVFVLRSSRAFSSMTPWLGLVLSLLLLGITRLPFLLVLPAHVALLSMFRTSRITKSLSACIGIFLILAIGLIAMKEIFDRFAQGGIETVTSYSLGRLTDTESLKSSVDASSTGMVRWLTTPLANANILQRISMVPLLVLIQYLLPFVFWTTQFIDVHTWFFAVNQLHLLWLVLVGPAFLFSILQFTKQNNATLQASFITGLLLYAFVAYVYLGVIPRYATPALVFILPLVGVVVFSSLGSLQLKQRLYQFYFAYFGLGFLGLFVYLIRSA